MTNAVSSTQSDSSSLIDAAARHQNTLFIIYVLVLLVGAFAAAIFTVLVYRAGNRYQSAIKADADARILKVKSDAEIESKRIEQQGSAAIAAAKSDAEQKIAETRNRTAQLEADAAKLREQNLAMELRLEAEKVTRLELEKSIAPRGFEIKVAASPNSNFEELKPFAGTNVIFEVLTDAEARRAENEIGNLVGFAGWKVVSVKSNPELWTGFFEGVSIVPPHSLMTFPIDKEKLAVRKKTERAAQSLALWLIDKNWKAAVRNNIPETEDIPDDTVKIYIGFKPNGFFDPDWVKGMQKEYEKMLKKQKAREDLNNPPPRQPNQD